MSENHFLNQFFYEVYEAMPRQGPGDRASTERALGFLPKLTRQHRLLDIGCGAGAQTLDLVRATSAQVTAVDNHAPFVTRLRSKAQALGVADRLTVLEGDMHALPFADGSFDCVWSEGAVFIIGFANGLASWRRLLVPGGHMVVSELCWLTDNPAPELRAFFDQEGAGCCGVAARRRTVEEAGYELIADFTLPAVGWWDNYYAPLSDRVAKLRAAHPNEPEALAVAERSEAEIDLYRRHHDAFGYVFFVMRLPR